jgi:hypothetical protein
MFPSLIMPVAIVQSLTNRSVLRKLEITKCSNFKRNQDAAAELQWLFQGTNLDTYR